MKFSGYPRPDGTCGTRNHLAVIPVVFCANQVAQKIAANIDGAFAFPHPLGCGYPGPDQLLAAHYMKRIAAHPNFGATLFVGLGCERITRGEVEAFMAGMQKPWSFVNIQDEGDTLKAVAKGTRIALEYTADLRRQKPRDMDLSHLVLGVKCGGTDAASGIAANPVLGAAADRVVSAGGTVLITEVTELLGTDHIMTRRAATPEAARNIQTLLNTARARLARAQRALPHIGKGDLLVSPGNADGGVTNVVEKALGGLHKAGTSPFQGTTGYAEPPAGKGLYLMDGPGHDGEAVSGLVGAGANVVVFTTGRGTPTGFPGVPVIKSTGNPHLFESMRANIDFNAGEVISKRRSIESVGADMLDAIVAAADGLPTRAEILGHEELYSISRFIATHRFFEYDDTCGCSCGT